MGFRYQELKERGVSIELERRESYTTERSHNGYIKRKKTIVRERFQQPSAKEFKNLHKRPQKTPSSEVSTTQRQGVAETGRTSTETYDYYTTGSRTLLRHCRGDKTHLELAVKRTSVQLKRLAHQIDNDIAKLKRERDKLMLRPHPHALTRNAAIQNDLGKCSDDEARIASTTATNANLKKFNAIANNIEFTIEKFSSQHKFVCTSPRYARDEQTSCRPRMRTIGLQKDTTRSNNTNSVFGDNLQNLKAKIDTALKNSPSKLANLKAKGLLDPAPPNCYAAYDYGGTGDGQNNALKICHLQNFRCAAGCNPPKGDCNCQKVCERTNTVNNYNGGMLCNKSRYVEKGVTPYSEFKYCRDEYHYDYPRPNSPCRPCQPYQPVSQSQQPCQGCVLPYLQPCSTYQESQPLAQPSKPKEQVIYGRRMSDLNTDEFYHPTGDASPKKPASNKHATSSRRTKTKERLTVNVPKDGRTLVDIERRGGRADSKSRRKREDEQAAKQRATQPYEASTKHKTNAKQQTREPSSQRRSESSGSADSTKKLRRMKSNKEKLIEITFTKEQRRRVSSGSGDDGVEHESCQQKSVREYTREVKRAMKQMTITAYKPCKPTESEGDNESARRKSKKEKSKERKGADSKSEDDQTWDERLRRGEQERQPRVEELPRGTEEVWTRAGIPTITEYYDNYRVGDAWEAEETNVAQQQQYVGAYSGDSFQVTPGRSYDILPVQKDTVRDIPRPATRSPVRGRGLAREGARDKPRPVTRSPVRGRGLARESARDANREDVIRSPPAANVRYTLESSRMRTDRYRVEESTVNRDYESHRDGPRTRPSAAIGAAEKSNSAREYETGYSDKRYMADRMSRREDRRTKTVYAQSEKPWWTRYHAYDGAAQADKKLEDESALQTHYERSSKPTRATIYAADTKPHSARSSRPSVVSAPEEKPHSARGYDDSAALKADKKYAGESSSRASYGTSKIKRATNHVPVENRRSADDTGRGHRGDEGFMADERPSGRDFHAPLEKSRSAQDDDHGAGPRSDKRYVGETLSRASYEPSSMPSAGSVYALDEKMHRTEDYDPSGEAKSAKRYVADNPPGADRKAGIVSGHDTGYTTNENLHSARESATGIESETEKRPLAYSTLGESHSLHHKPQRGSPRGQGPEITSTGQESLHRVRRDLKSSSRYDESLIADVMPSNEKLRSAELTKQTSQNAEKSYRDLLQRDLTKLSKGALDGYASKEKNPADYIQEKDGKPKIREDHAEKVKMGPLGKFIEPEKAGASSSDVHRKEEKKDSLGVSHMSGLKSEKASAEGPSVEAVRNVNSPLSSTRKDSDYRGLEVPEIHIEDNDESGRSVKSGRAESTRTGLLERAKFAFKGEMVLEPQYSLLDGIYPTQAEYRTKKAEEAGGGASETYQKPDKTDDTTKTGMTKRAMEEGAARFGNASALDESHAYGRWGEAADVAGRPQLSPFPSLESPRIYMRPRAACPDYGTACLPPTSDYPQKYSPRLSCVENAGDLYMRTPESYHRCQPTSLCPCVTPNRSCNEIPYDKLGDQYTHSPVRQLAANSHLAVALQPDAATGNYIPAPQPKGSKSCIYLRSTGTQYSATILENHEDRCAPQYIPLPKDCSQMSLEEQKEPPASATIIGNHEDRCAPQYIPLPKDCSQMSLKGQNEPPAATCCTESCDGPCEDLQSVSRARQYNYKFLCEEDEAEEKNEVYAGTTYINNDQWRQKVEVTNSEKTDTFIEQQQAKENSPRSECKNSSSPWQANQKFIPGQPMRDCDVRDAGVQQQPRYPSLTDRRMPRFNATLRAHQEMPEEEAKCAEEMSQYRPQPRVKFMEQNLQQYESPEACGYPQAEESNFQAESMESMDGYESSERAGFNDCREFQQIPKFTGCPCMYKTYLNMLTIYYPDCRLQMPDEIAVDEENNCCCNDDD